MVSKFWKFVDMQKFAERLRLCMFWEELRQWSLALRAGVSSSTVSRWCNGQGRPNSRNREIICTIFGVTEAELMQGTYLKGHEPVVDYTEQQDIAWDGQPTAAAVKQPELALDGPKEPGPEEKAPHLDIEIISVPALEEMNVLVLDNPTVQKVGADLQGLGIDAPVAVYREVTIEVDIPTSVRVKLSCKS